MANQILVLLLLGLACADFTLDRLRIALSAHVLVAATRQSDASQTASAARTNTPGEVASPVRIPGTVSPCAISSGGLAARLALASSKYRRAFFKLMHRRQSADYRMRGRSVSSSSSSLIWQLVFLEMWRAWIYRSCGQYVAEDIQTRNRTWDKLTPLGLERDQLAELRQQLFVNLSQLATAIAVDNWPSAERGLPPLRAYSVHSIPPSVHSIQISPFFHSVHSIHPFHSIPFLLH